MCSGAGHTTRLVRGSPIRTSSDQRSVDSSPRLIAASYVLHRLLVPRHPPCALNNLATHKHRTPAPGRTPFCGPTRTLLIRVRKDARVHCAVLNVQPDTGHPTPPDPPRPQTEQRYAMQTGPAREDTRPPPAGGGSALSGPTSVPTPRITHTHPVPRAARDAVLGAAAAAGRTGQRSTLEHHPRHLQPSETGWPLATSARPGTTRQRLAASAL